jgi:signal transduction histidine kinase/CheY-like chemotaxis protein
MNLAVAVCGNFEPEARQVLADPELRGADAITLRELPAHCGRPPLAAQALDEVHTGLAGRVEVIGGACCARLPGACGPCQVHRLAQCFELVAPPPLVAHHLARGAYLVTPGWLAHWRARVAHLGIDAATAPAIFGESMQRVVLLDTGAVPGCAELLQEFAAFVGLPAEIVPVGLDYVRLQLAGLVTRRRLEAERLESLAALGMAHRRSTEYAAAFDLLGTLTEIAEEQQAIRRALDVFGMLFAPRQATFVSVVDGAPTAVVSLPPSAVDAAALVARARRCGGHCVEGDGLLLPIKHQELLGVVALEGIAAPEHVRRDHALPLTIAGVCGLAISNAREYEKVKRAEEARARELSARARAELENEATVEFLRLINASSGVRDLVRAAVAFFQEKTGCEAVGVRLREGDDFPYYEARGFPREFVQLENDLCARDEAGNVRRDGSGDPVVECMCGNVICGRVDPRKTFFTPGGTFWSNDTTRLLATPTGDDRRARIRNRCNREGYQSVALIPLRVGQERLGLLQLNDRRTGMFTPEGLALWERCVGYLSVAVAKARAEEALRAAHERLVEADGRKNEFLAMLSHELRNPLAPIRNSIYILERAAPGGEQATRAREVIDRQAQQLTKLIDDLLDVTRISRGKIRLQRERVELNRIVRGTGEDLHEVFRRNGIELSVSVTAVPLFVDGDPTRIAQMVGNVLQNASKFTHRGGHASLTLDLERPGWASIQVRDDGVGIQHELLPELFEPFVQADRTLDRSRGGLGLGLALVKGLAELHGGRVSVESDGPGKGAQFTIRLPVETLARSRLSVVRPPDGAATRARRILVIEDNTDAAETLEVALEMCDHEVEVAYSGDEGLERSRTWRPDLILCDIGLPGIDGYAVAKAIRADPALRSIPLVALTGYAGPDDVERALAAGFDRHLAKPPDMSAVKKALAELPAGSGAAREG